MICLLYTSQDAITIAFKSQLPKMDKVEFNVMTQALGENTAPVMITQSEYMRRMKAVSYTHLDVYKRQDIDLIGSVTAEVIDRNRTAVLAIPENTPFKPVSYTHLRRD